jgi:hypothetical protein
LRPDEIVAIGAGEAGDVNGQSLQLGQRVIWSVTLPCGTCRRRRFQCKVGDRDRSRHRKTMHGKTIRWTDAAASPREPRTSDVLVESSGASATRNRPFRFDEQRGPEKNPIMKMKPMIVAALAAGLLTSGSGVALADPDVPPAPDPKGPKCWGSSDTGYMHWAYLPCGWTYSDTEGWQQIPPPPAP